MRKVLTSKAEALLVLARASNKRCQGGSYLMRVITKMQQLQSENVSNFRKRIVLCSERAKDIHDNLELKYSEFKTHVRYDHSTPLEMIWNEIIADPYKLSAENVLTKLSRSRIVIISRDEDARLNGLNLRSTGEEDSRYRTANIKVVNLSANRFAPA